MKFKALLALFLMLSPLAAWADTQQPAKWEYAEYEESNAWGGYLRINGHKFEEMKKSSLVDDIGGQHTTAGDKIDLFNTLGAQGWELVGTSQRAGVNPCYIFKRPQPQTPALSSQQ